MLELAIGFALGWLVFKRPDFMTNAIEWVKSKVGLGTPAA